MDLSKKHIAVMNEFGAEFLGTFIILFFGNGCGGAMQLKAIEGSWEAGIIWGLAVACAIFSSASVSGAHLNPAVTLGMACCGKLPFWKIAHYITAQLMGALTGSTIIYSLFWSTIQDYEREHNIIRGEKGSFRSSSMFRCTLNPSISSVQGFYIELVITAMLLIVICFLNDKNASEVGYGSYFPPMMIGLTIAVVIGAFGPLTSACLNPARDLGPRLLTLFAGWGKSAFPGETQDPIWPFVCGPIAGGIIGGLVWELLGSRMYRYAAENRRATGIFNDEFPRISGMGSSLYEPLYTEERGKKV